MVPRTILHCDCNNFYASVEQLYHPALRGRPLAVAGDPEQRHGIVLAKNELAKRCGVRTGHPPLAGPAALPGPPFLSRRITPSTAGFPVCAGKSTADIPTRWNPSGWTNAGWT